MKKILTILVVLCIALFTNAQETNETNAIHLTQGDLSVWYALNQNPTFTFSDNGISINGKTYELSGTAINITFGTAPTPEFTLMLADGKTPAGWINFGAKTISTGTYSDSRTYSIKAENIIEGTLSVAVVGGEDKDYFTVSEVNPNDSTFTISYTGIPADIEKKYELQLEVRATTLLGESNWTESLCTINLDVNTNGKLTSIDNTTKTDNVRKVIINNQIYIIKDGVFYNVVGIKL